MLGAFDGLVELVDAFVDVVVLALIIAMEIRDRAAGAMTDGKTHRYSDSPAVREHRCRSGHRMGTGTVPLLNDTQTVYPGTDLVLSYSVKPRPGAT